MPDAVIVKLYSDFADVAWERTPEEREAVETVKLRGRLAHRRRGPSAILAAGDRVRVAIDGGSAVIEEVLPRRTELTRRDPRNPRRELVVAANVDRVLVCASAERPPFSAGLVDRHLVAASVAGLRAALAITKCDLATSEEIERLVEPWVLAGIPVHRLRRDDPGAVEKLRTEWLAGWATVLVGRSGVGKSTLRNALVDSTAVRAATSEVSTKTGKGKHRTTAATFEPLPPAGFLVDTPGVREFGLARLSPRDVHGHFPEFAELQCEFRDCAHDINRGCAIRAAVRSGHAHPSRLRSLLAIAASS